MEDVAFLTAIASEPTDLTTQLVYADWLAERDRPEETAWRWIAAFRRRPSPFRQIRLNREPYWTAVRTNLLQNETLAGWGWGEWDYPTLRWPWSAGLSMIPKPVFRFLPKARTIFDTNRGSERGYNSVAEAFTALVSGFMAASRPRRTRFDRWLNGNAYHPDWALASEVPYDE